VICAFRPLLTLLSAWQLTGHPDAIALSDAARMFNVPQELMWAVAYQETHHDITNTPVSYMGAVGRMQVMPTVWGRFCGRLWGRARYSTNVACGAMVLRYYLDRCNDDQLCAAWHYVGGDSAYAREVGLRSLLFELKVRATWPSSTGVRRLDSPS
jgi:soluble lytic murein transglycosylase-like protein